MALIVDNAKIATTPGGTLKPGAVEVRRLQTLVAGRLSWNLVGTIAYQVATALIGLMVARMLGRDQYGRFCFVQTTALALVNFGTVGTGSLATRTVAQLGLLSPGRIGRTLGLASVTSMVLGLVLSIATMAFAGKLAPHVSGDTAFPTTATLLRIGAIGALFLTMNAYQIGGLVGLGAFRIIALLNVIYLAVGSTLTIVSANVFGIRGAVASLAVNFGGLWWIHHIALARELAAVQVRVRYVGCHREIGDLLGFCLPATISGLIGNAAIWAQSIALARLPSGYGEVALLGVCMQFRALVLFAPGLLSRVLAPVLIATVQSDTAGRYRRLYWGLVAAAGAVAACVAILLGFSGRQLLRLYGSNFVDPHGATLLILLASVIEVVACVLYTSLFVHNRLWVQVGINLVWSIVLVGGSLKFVASHGAAGVAAAYFLAWTCSLCLYLAAAYYVERQAGTTLFDRKSEAKVC